MAALRASYHRILDKVEHMLPAKLRPLYNHPAGKVHCTITRQVKYCTLHPCVPAASSCEDRVSCCRIWMPELNESQCFNSVASADLNLLTVQLHSLGIKKDAAFLSKICYDYKTLVSTPFSNKLICCVTVLVYLCKWNTKHIHSVEKITSVLVICCMFKIQRSYTFGGLSICLWIKHLQDCFVLL